ncbi:MAG: PfkB family carbohydrate kinase [Dehalococcoidia bacterium]|nr:PfkB family carbohydrate kinase [Dehalococcoidia bacterium]
MNTEAKATSVAVLEPAPLYTVTVEAGEQGEPEVHFHAGGQGVWVARMVMRLGERAVLCGPLGGESGRVVRVLLEDEGIDVHEVTTDQANGGYIHDRRQGDRETVVDVDSPVLSRHDSDNLYDAMLVNALEAGVAVISGDGSRGIADPGFFARLARDLGSNGVLTVADVSGEALRAFEGGLAMLKVSEQDLARDGFLTSPDEGELIEWIQEFGRTKAEHVIVSRAEQPALALVDGRLLQLHPPRFEPADHRGAGDSMTAGLAIGLARKLSTDDVLRLASAAGALNVTRHGLGTGTGSQIEQLAERVELTEVSQVPR